jgi:hypothetical protein
MDFHGVPPSVILSNTNSIKIFTVCKQEILMAPASPLEEHDADAAFLAQRLHLRFLKRTRPPPWKKRPRHFADAAKGRDYNPWVDDISYNPPNYNATRRNHENFTLPSSELHSAGRARPRRYLRPIDSSYHRRHAAIWFPIAPDFC